MKSIIVFVLILILQFPFAENTYAQRLRNSGKNHIGLDVSPLFLSSNFYRILYGRSLGSINFRGGLGGVYLVGNQQLDSTTSFQINKLDYCALVGVEGVIGKRDNFLTI